MKKKRAEAENKLTRVVAIAVVSVIMVIVIIAAFTINFNKIYGLLLEKRYGTGEVYLQFCYETDQHRN